ncbi:MAG: hydroxymethylpyrimidine/phosphomethylpyrimidine kinase [Cyclobacteriaceae bacterium]|nr:hydroxymethylpyrimidine/phosphomethylpyrimidine kinase [Cyclobacteriaceae bacterium]
MVKEHNYALTIAGFDPSGGAGILADVKTFEAHKITGMGAVSGLTFQNDKEFDSVHWVEAVEIIKQVAVLTRRFTFPVIKIGIIESLDTLEAIIANMKTSAENPLIIWDSVIKASVGFDFHEKFNEKQLFGLLDQIYLITPNIDEVKFLTGMSDPIAAARKLSRYCNVLLKGGHNPENPGVDYLFVNEECEKLMPEKHCGFQKHGSGCVLSSAIAANLILGYDLIASCRNAKNYIEQFLSSNQSLLGSHHVQ